MKEEPFLLLNFKFQIIFKDEKTINPPTIENKIDQQEKKTRKIRFEDNFGQEVPKPVRLEKARTKTMNFGI